jgi:hypothetical protein
LGTKYSDELVGTVAKLINGSKADAIKYLDKAALDGGAITRLEIVALTWGGRVNRIADDVIPRYFSVPDDQAAARAFVVGTACDAFKKQQESLLARVTPAEMQRIVAENRSKSRLPAIVGKAEFVTDVVSAINKALAQRDIRAAFPDLTRAVICNRLG